MLSYVPGLAVYPLKAGSATFPLPGIDAVVVDENGQPTEPGKRGYIVIRKPWPGMLMTLYNDDERYKQVYWSRFENCYYPGDWAKLDEDGYFWLLGRADEVLKIAGHRIGTAELESAVTELDFVAEAAVVGVEDPVKGQAIVVFAVPTADTQPSKELEEKVRQHVRQTIGPIATPKAVVFLQQLPKTRSGKIMRRLLKAVFEGKQLGDVTTLEDEASVEQVKQAYEHVKAALQG